MLRLMGRLYKGQCSMEQDDSAVDLTNAERTELLPLAVLAPMMVADLRLPHSRRLRSPDASIWGIAGCSTEAPVGVHEEFWRRRIRRGCYTRLSRGALKVLREHGE